MGLLSNIRAPLNFLVNFFYYVVGFDVAKTGDARIGFVGFPSVGKSTLLSNLAGVYSEVAAYEFTTLTTVPGVIRYKGAKIQVRTFCSQEGGVYSLALAVAELSSLLLIS